MSDTPKFDNALELAGWIWTLGCFAHVTMDVEYGKLIATAVDAYAADVVSDAIDVANALKRAAADDSLTAMTDAEIDKIADAPPGTLAFDGPTGGVVWMAKEIRRLRSEVAGVRTPLWPSDQRELLPRLATAIAECAARFPADSVARDTMNICADMVRDYPVAEEGPRG